MPEKTKYTGFAIALAWPETYCKQAGAWYDPVMNFLGINTNFHYKVGHAAVILVDGRNGSCLYFDFGRYHAPFGYGRVRNKETDHDLTIHSKAIISDSGSIVNLNEILFEIYHNPSCHGNGPVHAASIKIRFDLAHKTVLKMQKRNPWKYGPFIREGTNCSRFVRSIILSGKPSPKNALKLSLPLTISPTPVGNVSSLGKRTIYQPERDDPPIKLKVAKPPQLSSSNLNKTLQIPIKGPSVPSTAQWLAGEGAGSWFNIERVNAGFKVNRYSESGKLECSGIFSKLVHFDLDISKPFKFQHISHCDQVRIEQNGRTISLKRIKTTTYNKKYDPYSYLQTQRS
jgi:hypothetical protein